MDFLSNFSYFFMLQAVQKGLQIITVPVMTAHLNPGDYGLIAINTAIATAALQFSNFGLTNFSERVTFKFFGSKTFSPVFGLTVFTGIFIGLVGSILLSVFPSLWDGFFLRNVKSPVKWFYLLPVWFALFQSLNTYYFFYLIDIKNGRLYFIINCIKTIAANLIPIAGLLFFRFTVVQVIVVYMLVEAAFAVYSVVCLIGIGTIDLKYIRFLKLGFSFGWPYFLFGFAGWTVQQVDKLFLGFYQGASVLGIYAISLSFCGIYSMFSQTISYSASPIIMAHLDRNKSREAEKKMEDVLNIYILGLQFCAALIAIFSQEAIYLLTNRMFHNAFRVVPLLLIGMVIKDMDAAFNSYHLMNKNKTFFYNALSFVQAAVILFLNYLLTPPYGVYGVAVALFASNLVIYVINRSYVSKKLGKYYSQRMIFVGLLYFSLNCVIIIATTSSLSAWAAVPLKVIDVSVVAAVLFVIYRKYEVFSEFKYRFMNMKWFRLKTSY